MPHPALDPARVRRISLAARKSKVERGLFAAVPPRRPSFADFYEGLPRILACEELRALVGAMRRARERKKPVLWMFGAHVIKVGLSPVVIDLMRRGMCSAIATNGAGAIHDAEIAMEGRTSEDVAEALADGSFGMSKETGEMLNGAAQEAARARIGFGEALGRRLIRLRAPHRRLSLFATAVERGLPATVHVAIGTDIVHPHPGASGAAIGDASMRDFHVLAALVSKLGSGGVALNVGSAVLLPEVFLKCVSMARNLGHAVRDFTTANLDMIQHYRPRVNVVHRPVLLGGRGISLTGHHELMVPLLAYALATADSERTRRRGMR